MEHEERQAVIDGEHLRLLSLFYYVTGAINLAWAFFPLIYVMMGAMMLSAPGGGAAVGQPPPQFIGWIFIIMGLAVSCAIGAAAVLKLCSGYFISKRRRRVFCLVTAGLSCLGIPYGTILGVFTFVVLNRRTVSELFGESQGESAGQPPYAEPDRMSPSLTSA